MYRKSTKFYNIPYISKGEFIEAEAEERKYTIIDNMLYAATFGVEKSLYEDGNYQLVKQTDGLYTLRITPYDGFSLLGILNYSLFCSRKTEEVKNLYSGNFYYLYAVYNSNMVNDNEGFGLILSEVSFPSSSPLSMLLCTIDLTKIEPKINENPSGKVYSKNVSAHILDNTNPHGRILYQDQIFTDEINIGDCKLSKIEYLDVELNIGLNEFVFNYKVNFVDYVFLQREISSIDIVLLDDKVLVRTDKKTKIRLRIEGEKNADII